MTHAQINAAVHAGHVYLQQHGYDSMIPPKFVLEFMTLGLKAAEEARLKEELTPEVPSVPAKKGAR